MKIEQIGDGKLYEKGQYESNFLEIISVKFLCRKCEEVRKSKIHFENYVHYIECPECKSNWIIEIDIKDRVIKKSSPRTKPPGIKITNATEERVVHDTDPPPTDTDYKKKIKGPF